MPLWSHWSWTWCCYTLIDKVKLIRLQCRSQLFLSHYEARKVTSCWNTELYKIVRHRRVLMAMLKLKVENIKASEHKIIFEQKSLKFEQLNLVGTYNTRWGGQNFIDKKCVWNNWNMIFLKMNIKKHMNLMFCSYFL